MTVRVEAYSFDTMTENKNVDFGAVARYRLRVVLKHCAKRAVFSYPQGPNLLLGQEAERNRRHIGPPARPRT